MFCLQKGLGQLANLAVGFEKVFECGCGQESCLLHGLFCDAGNIHKSDTFLPKG